jgi:hypothetical protein
MINVASKNFEMYVTGHPASEENAMGRKKAGFFDVLEGMIAKAPANADRDKVVAWLRDQPASHFANFSGLSTVMPILKDAAAKLGIPG